MNHCERTLHCLSLTVSFAKECLLYVKCFVFGTFRLLAMASTLLSIWEGRTLVKLRPRSISLSTLISSGFGHLVLRRCLSEMLTLVRTSFLIHPTWCSSIVQQSTIQTEMLSATLWTRTDASRSFVGDILLVNDPVKPFDNC